MAIIPPTLEHLNLPNDGYYNGRRDHAKRTAHMTTVLGPVNATFQKCTRWSENTVSEKLEKQVCFYDLQKRISGGTWLLFSPGRERQCPKSIRKQQNEMKICLDRYRKELWPETDNIFTIVKKHGIRAPWLYWSTEPKLWTRSYIFDPDPYLKDNGWEVNPEKRRWKP